jgi:hypothetical protein
LSARQDQRSVAENYEFANGSILATIQHCDKPFGVISTMKTLITLKIVLAIPA